VLIDVQGISDRVQGTLGSAASGLTGDREAQERYNAMHDSGKTLQKGVEAELDRQNPQ
jgi:hypothetical protein